MRLPLHISPALDIAIGAVTVQLTPRQGLALAEDLARKAFRAAMTEEAVRHGVPLDVPAPRTRRTRRLAA